LYFLFWISQGWLRVGHTGSPVAQPQVGDSIRKGNGISKLYTHSLRHDRTPLTRSLPQLQVMIWKIDLGSPGTVARFLRHPELRLAQGHAWRALYKACGNYYWRSPRGHTVYLALGNPAMLRPPV
jgi:hypothetical protein